MRTPAVSVCVSSFLALAGCVGPAGPEGSAVQPLVNGAPSFDAAVVAVIHTRPAGTRQLCTGTLIAPTVVLTAKHCVFEDLGGAEWVPNPTSSMTVSLGDSVTAPTGEIAVTAIATTPGPYHDGDGAIGGDIALLTLASAPPGITPVAVAAVPPTDGLALRIAGFGYTGAGSTGTLGTRNQGTASVTAVAAGTFTSEGASWTCTGDSGGPAFRTSDGAVIGVTSIGPRGCPASTSIYTRLDVHRDFFIAAGIDVGGPLDAGASEDAGSSVPTDGGPSATVDAGGSPPPPARPGGCGCRVMRQPGSGASGILLLALAVALARRTTTRRSAGRTGPRGVTRRGAGPGWQRRRGAEDERVRPFAQRRVTSARNRSRTRRERPRSKLLGRCPGSASRNAS